MDGEGGRSGGCWEADVSRGRKKAAGEFRRESESEKGVGEMQSWSQGE